MNETHNAWDVILQYGPIAIILFSILYAIYRGVKYVGLRLFDPDLGIVSILTASINDCNARNSTTLEGLKQTSDRQQNLCDRHGQSLQALTESHSRLIDWHADPTNPKVAHAIQQGLLQACDSLEAICEKHAPDLNCGREIASIREKLKS